MRSWRLSSATTGFEGEVTPFLDDMPGAYAEADLVVSRSGAGAVAEMAAAGKPAILVPFPYAADDHQLANARSMERIGAARVVLDRECDGQRLFGEIAALARDCEAVLRMGQAARQAARPGAANRAADLLEELAAKRTERG
jgi:UDP-N-acetylglucosamine--N-acetylmuramyl-(pentapeptide) pyrophosphoryl-undecaprenol N-acetylglucosamine transferase